MIIMIIDKKHLNRLILAKEFLNHAKEHIIKKDNINLSIAILSIDNTFEYLVKTLASFYKVEYSSDESLKKVYINISNYIRGRKINSIGLPQFSKYEPLRIMRNHIQHEKPILFSDVEEFYDLVEEFFKIQIKVLFNLDYDNIDIINLIKSEELQIFIRDACVEWTRDNMRAMSLLRDAFDNAKREYLYELFTWEYINIDTLSLYNSIDYEVKNMLLNNIEYTLLSSLGIDLVELNSYKDIIDYIPENYRSEYHGGRKVMFEDENYEYDQFIFAKNFVINSIIKMQEKDQINRISSIHKKEHKFFSNMKDRKWTLNGNEIRENEYSFMSGGFKRNEIIHGFEIDEMQIDFFRSVKKDSILLDQHYIKESGNYILTLQGKVKVNDIKIEIMTHNPKRWKVIIALENMEES